MAKPDLLAALTGLVTRLAGAIAAQLPTPPAAPSPASPAGWTSVGRYVRGGWRSAAAWVCVLVLFINGAVLPIARLFHFQGEPLDWMGLAAFVAGLVGLTHYRSKDLAQGVTS